MRPRHAGRGLLAVLLISLLPACGADPSSFEMGDSPSSDELGVWRSGLTVGQAGGCSTGIVAGLSRQLIEELNCIRPNTLVDFRGPGISVGSTVWPYLEEPAAQALKAAVRARGGTIHVNSAFRTLAQQYLLKKWEGTCGIQIAANPGSSNHESGLALDVADYDAWRSALQNRGWQWYGSGDRVHYTYVGSGARDLRSDSVRAFQRLWNKNHPNDRIAEDGVYGPATADRLRRSPADGFAVHGCLPEFAAKLVGVRHPDVMTAGQTAQAVIRLKNTGTRTWGNKVRIGTTVARDRASRFVAGDWINAARPTTVDGGSCAPGATCAFTFTLKAPNVATQQQFNEHFGVVRNGEWFAGLGGRAIAMPITVRPAPQPQPQLQPEPEPDPEPQPEPDPQAEPEPQPEPDPQPEPEPQPEPDLDPASELGDDESLPPADPVSDPTVGPQPGVPFEPDVEAEEPELPPPGDPGALGTPPPPTDTIGAGCSVGASGSTAPTAPLAALVLLLVAGRLARRQRP